jgi:2-polyprenyl-6-methoxyphenol hydroxylase-like FAD-dependent oxidoreductase
MPFAAFCSRTQRQPRPIGLSDNNHRTVSETAGIFTNGDLPLPRSLVARKVKCARRYLEESKVAELIEYGLWFTQQEPHGSHELGKRAGVIGAGIGGLAAAGALAPYFEQVEILERDRLPATAGSRSGASQDRHPHGLLADGLQALGQIFPGFENGLAAAGAVPVTFARDVQFERPDVGVLPKRDFGIAVLCGTRPLIELVLRRRAEAIANVTLRPSTRVTAIVPTADSAGARGVRIANGSGCPEILDADLVVDASGRGGPTLTLFDDLGWNRPETTEVGVDITYSTAVLNIPSHVTTAWKAVLTLADPGRVPLHAVMLPTEDGRWIITIADHSATTWIETWDAFLEASRS